MAITKPQWKVFVSEMVKNGDHILAYKAAYPDCKDDKLAATSGKRLLKNVEIVAAIQSRSAQITELVTQNIVEKISDVEIGNVLSFHHKREILFQIATGQYMVARKFLVKGKGRGKGSWIEKTVMEPPTQTEVIKAIHLDNLMTGDMASDRREIPGEGGAVKMLPQMNDEQFFKFVEMINCNVQVNHYHGTNSADTGQQIQGPDS